MNYKNSFAVKKTVKKDHISYYRDFVPDGKDCADHEPRDEPG